MDDLLEVSYATSEMAELLTEVSTYWTALSIKLTLIQVFTGGKEICLRIRETQIDRIFKLIVKSECSGRPQLLEMLQAIVKVCYKIATIIHLHYY